MVETQATADVSQATDRSLGPASNSYVLGHSEQELNRLIAQGRFFGELTETFLRAAGLAPGMRVLDVGCGAGDVSFLAGRLVGPAGEVVGIDKSPEAVAIASRRAEGEGLRQVHFQVADAMHLTLDTFEAQHAPVDALIGRLVLQYFPDPAVVLRRLAGLVKPGGIIAFQEIDMRSASSEPYVSLFEEAGARIRQAFTRAGTDDRIGVKLGVIFEEAGLPSPSLTLGARVERGPDSPVYEQVAQVMRTLLPVMEATGIATREEVDVDTLAARLRAETMAHNATITSPSLIGAWTRKR